MIPARLRERLRAWAAAFDKEALRLARLFRLYRNAAARGWRIVDCSHWEFYMFQVKHPHLRWPPSGTCEVEELEQVLRGEP